jgi:predicted PurR-regulated permease PerM
VAGLGFVPLFLYFALVSGGHLRRQTESFLAVFSATTKTNVLYSIDVFTRQVTGFFQGQLVIAMIMGAMFAAGFTSIGLKGGILIGLVLGLLNIVPFLGTLVGLLIVLPMAYFQPGGSLHLLLLGLLVFTVVQLVESWLLTPKIMANRSGLHPALVVISVFFWGTALDGIIGMILAVPLTAFLVAVWAQAKASLTRGMMSDNDLGRIEIPPGSPLVDPLVRHATDAAVVAD